MTGLRLRKLVRDIWATRTRMAMMTIAIAVSVLAITGFLSARAVIGQQITRNYLATHPASATLQVPGGLDRATLDAVRARPGIVAATTRTSLMARIKVGDRPWQMMLLFASDPADPRRVSTVTVERGTWPPPAGGLMLERTALPFLGIRTGDQVTVQTADGGSVPMRVVGSVHDGGVAPARQEQTAYAYLTTDALARLGTRTVLDRLEIVVGGSGGTSGDAGAIERTAQGLGSWLAANGHPVSHIEVPPPLRHPHQGQQVTVGFILLAFGIVALLLSSILVATMLGGMLTGQIRQIGAMKAVGARTGQILSMYLWLTAAIGAVATALALPLGLVLGKALAGQAATMLNLDLSSTTTPAWVYLTVLVAGVGVPLLVALVPLVRGSRVTVRQAIDDHGVDPAATAGTRLERWLARLRGPSRAQLMALRNTFRRRGRLALSVGLLAVAGAMFLTGLNAANGWTALVDEGLSHRHYDLEVRLARSQHTDRITELVRRVPGVVDVEGWGRAPTSVHAPGLIDTSHVYPDETHVSFTVLAPPADTPLLRLPLLSGRWLRPDDTDAVVLNHLVPVQQLPGVKVGDTISLTIDGKPTAWHVVGMASDFGTQGAAYLTDRELAKVTGDTGQSQMLRIVTSGHSGTARQDTLNRIEAALGSAGVGIAQDYTVSTFQAGLDGHVLVLADALIALAMVMGLVGLLGLASTMSTNVIERTREFAVLNTVGATPGTIRGVVVTEGTLTSGLSIALATVAALPLTRVLGDFLGSQAFRMDLPYRFSVAALLLWTVIALLGAAGASAGAAFRASRLTIREALTTL